MLSLLPSFNMAERQASILGECHIRGRHIYKQIWRLLVGEILEWEEGNNHDKFTVSLLKHATVLGNVPREFLRVFSGTERPSLVKLP